MFFQELLLQELWIIFYSEICYFWWLYPAFELYLEARKGEIQLNGTCDTSTTYLLSCILLFWYKSICWPRIKYSWERLYSYDYSDFQKSLANNANFYVWSKPNPDIHMNIIFTANKRTWRRISVLYIVVMCEHRRQRTRLAWRHAASISQIFREDHSMGCFIIFLCWLENWRFTQGTS